LVISIVILQGSVFSRLTAYLRLASSLFDFGIFGPTIGIFNARLSVFCLMGFNIMVTRRLLQSAESSGTPTPPPPQAGEEI
jgi:hypothetical protein